MIGRKETIHKTNEKKTKSQQNFTNYRKKINQQNKYKRAIVLCGSLQCHSQIIVFLLCVCLMGVWAAFSCTQVVPPTLQALILIHCTLLFDSEMLINCTSLPVFLSLPVK